MVSIEALSRSRRHVCTGASGRAPVAGAGVETRELFLRNFSSNGDMTNQSFSKLPGPLYGHQGSAK